MCLSSFPVFDSFCIWRVYCMCFCQGGEKAVSVCGPIVLLQHPEKRNMALSGVSLHTAYHSITSHAA